MDELRSMSHLGILNEWCRRVSECMAAKQEELEQETRFLPVSVQQKLTAARIDAKKLTVTRAGKHIYHISPALDGFAIVDLDSRSCTCGEFYDQQFPCGHIIACLKRLDLFHDRVGHFIDEIYQSGTLRQLYDNSMLAVPYGNLKADIQQRIPPVMEKRRGRRKTKRMKSALELASGKRKRITANESNAVSLASTLPTTQTVSPPLPVVSPSQPSSLQQHASASQQSPARKVVCKNCGANHYAKKTACRPAQARRQSNE